MNKVKKMVVGALAVAGALTLTACADDRDVVDHNITKAADNFEVIRRIALFNGITDNYLMEITGRCAIKDEGHQFEVICKTGPDEYQKHHLGLSDNVSYFSEQIGTTDADEYNYRVTFKPETLIPAIDLRTSNEG